MPCMCVQTYDEVSCYWMRSLSRCAHAMLDARKPWLILFPFDDISTPMDVLCKKAIYNVGTLRFIGHIQWWQDIFDVGIAIGES